MAWADVYDEVLLPVQQAHRDAFAAAVTTQRDAIQARLETIARVDAELDERVLTLYGITDAADRARIVGSAPIDEEEESDVAPTPTNSDNE